MGKQKEIDFALEMARIEPLIDVLVDKMKQELIFSCEKYKDDPMTIEDMETAWDTIHIELWELKREIDRKNTHPDKLFKEALQTATMGLKFLLFVAFPLFKNND